MINSADPLNGLFKARVPEAAAYQLAIVLAWLTECQLATLEGLSSKKSTPKGELARQQGICEDAVRQCADLGLAPGVRGLRGSPCSRLDQALKSLAIVGHVSGGEKKTILVGSNAEMVLPGRCLE